MTISFSMIPLDLEREGRQDTNQDGSPRMTPGPTPKPYEYFIRPYRSQDSWDLEWNANGLAEGTINGFDLAKKDRDFTVRFHSSPDELKNWLKTYCAEKPEEALPLLAEALQIAVAASVADVGS